MRAWLVGVLLAAGCGGVDLCGDEPTRACLTVHLRGAVDADATITQLQVDVSYTDTRDARSGLVREYAGPQAGVEPRLPIVFRIVYPEGASVDIIDRLSIAVLDGARVVGYGGAPRPPDLAVRQHGHVTIDVAPADGHPCALTQAACHTMDTCPACGPGDACSYSGDCLAGLTCRNGSCGP